MLERCWSLGILMCGVLLKATRGQEEGTRRQDEGFQQACESYGAGLSFLEALGLDAATLAAAFQRHWMHWPAATLAPRCDLRFSAERIIELVPIATAHDTAILQQRGNLSLRNALLEITSVESSNVSGQQRQKMWLPADAALAAMANGTVNIVVTEVERLWPALAWLVARAQALFFAPISVNSYLTPGRLGSGAFDIHADAHDAFILQVGGEKRWRLCGQNMTSPVQPVAFSPLGYPCVDVLMRKGDVLYMPFGVVHEAAVTSSQPSAHMSIGVYRTRRGTAIDIAVRPRCVECLKLGSLPVLGSWLLTGAGLLLGAAGAQVFAGRIDASEYRNLGDAIMIVMLDLPQLTRAPSALNGITRTRGPAGLGFLVRLRELPLANIVEESLIIEVRELAERVAALIDTSLRQLVWKALLEATRPEALRVVLLAYRAAMRNFIHEQRLPLAAAAVASETEMFDAGEHIANIPGFEPLIKLIGSKAAPAEAPGAADADQHGTPTQNLPTRSALSMVGEPAIATKAIPRKLVPINVNHTVRMLDQLSAHSHTLAHDVIVTGQVPDGMDKQLDELAKLTQGLLSNIEEVRVPYVSQQFSRLDEHIKSIGALRLNVASGTSPIPGFVNIDASNIYSPNLHMNVNWGFPFVDNTVEVVYCSHFLEHLYHSEVKFLLQQVLRVLRPGGTLRLVVPDIRRLLEAYVANETMFLEGRKRIWHWWRWDDFGTVLPSILPYMGVARQPMAYAPGHHTGFDFETLRHSLLTTGFGDVARTTYAQSRVPALADCDQHSQQGKEEVPGSPGDYYSLFVEASKPQQR